MPFDGTEFSIEVRVIEEMLRLLRNGRCWLQHRWEIGGKRCLLATLDHACIRLNADAHRPTCYILRVIDKQYGYDKADYCASVVAFNDVEGRTFAEVREVLLAALEDAKKHPKARFPLPRDPIVRVPKFLMPKFLM
jgi:hypothetical protein